MGAQARLAAASGLRCYVVGCCVVTAVVVAGCADDDAGTAPTATAIAVTSAPETATAMTPSIPTAPGATAATDATEPTTTAAVPPRSTRPATTLFRVITAEGELTAGEAAAAVAGTPLEALSHEALAVIGHGLCEASVREIGFVDELAWRVLVEGHAPFPSLQFVPPVGEMDPFEAASTLEAVLAVVVATCPQLAPNAMPNVAALTFAYRDGLTVYGEDQGLAYLHAYDPALADRVAASAATGYPVVGQDRMAVYGAFGVAGFDTVDEFSAVVGSSLAVDAVAV